jgi:hypothetical protein
MEQNLSLGYLITEREPLEVFGRHIAVSKVWVADESKTAIVERVSENDTALCVHSSQMVQSSLNQSVAYALALQVGPH